MFSVRLSDTIDVSDESFLSNVLKELLPVMQRITKEMKKQAIPPSSSILTSPISSSSPSTAEAHRSRSTLNFGFVSLIRAVLCTTTDGIGLLSEAGIIPLMLRHSVSVYVRPSCSVQCLETHFLETDSTHILFVDTVADISARFKLSLPCFQPWFKSVKRNDDDDDDNSPRSDISCIVRCITDYHRFLNSDQLSSNVSSSSSSSLSSPSSKSSAKGKDVSQDFNASSDTITSFLQIKHLLRIVCAVLDGFHDDKTSRRKQTHQHDSKLLCLNVKIIFDSCISCVNVEMQKEIIRTWRLNESFCNAVREIWCFLDQTSNEFRCLRKIGNHACMNQMMSHDNAVYFINSFVLISMLACMYE
jgi:hypothetical protein